MATTVQKARSVPSLLKRWQKTRREMLNNRLELSKLENSLAEHFDLNKPVSHGGIRGSYADVLLDVDGYGGPEEPDEDEEDDWLDVAIAHAVS